MSTEFPDQDLQSLARLQYGKKAEQIQEEFEQERRQLAATLARDGQYQSGKTLKQHLRLHLKRTEAMARSLCEIWMDLFKRKYGRLTYEHVQYIRTAVQQVLSASTLSGRPFEGSTRWDARTLVEAKKRHEAALDDLARNIHRDLEITLKQQRLSSEDGAKAAAPAAVTVTGELNWVNLGSVDSSLKVGPPTNDVSELPQTVAKSEDVQQSTVPDGPSPRLATQKWSRSDKIAAVAVIVAVVAVIAGFLIPEGRRFLGLDAAPEKAVSGSAKPNGSETATPSKTNTDGDPGASAPVSIRDSVTLAVRRASADSGAHMATGTTTGNGEQEIELGVSPTKLIFEPNGTAVEEGSLPKDVHLDGGKITIVRFTGRGFVINDHGVWNLKFTAYMVEGRPDSPKK